MSTTRTRTRTALLALAAGLALTLTACGGSDSTAAATTPSSAASTARAADGVSSEHNEADITFTNGMHPHHQSAIAMAELARTRPSSPSVKDLAARIAQAQGPEMTRMEDMAKAWGVELGGAGGHGGHGGGMEMGQDTAALEELSGVEFDRHFLTVMIAHHESALPMARTELAQGRNPAAKAMAEEIIDAQEAEVTEMKQLLTEL